MASESRFIVKDGREGGEINSANASSWNGIKVEGKGYFLINPNTQIDGNYFYAYADNTPLPNGKTIILKSIKSVPPIQAQMQTPTYKIYPNPTGDFINIDAKKRDNKNRSL